MKQFSCGDVVPGCQRSFQASTETDLLAQVASHASADHGLSVLPPSLIEQVRSNIRAA